jgi:hypothetical protein
MVMTKRYGGCVRISMIFLNLLMNKKDLKCLQKNITLIRIREKDWNKNKKHELKRVYDTVASKSS